MVSLPRQKSKPVWQKPQEERRKKGRKSAIRLWLLGIFLLLSAGLAIKTYQMLQGSLWDGQGRFNVALATTAQVSLVSFDPREEGLIVLVIPKNTQIEVTHGYGKYRVEAIPTLEQIEKRNDLLTESLQETLGVPVDGWLYTTEDERQKTEDSKGMVLEILKGKLLGQGKTNLSRWDLVRLWWQARKVRFDKVKILYLSKISVLKPFVLPDQTQVWEIETKSLDIPLEPLFSDPKIRGENLAIEILNGTDHPGLAERAARLISNLGGEVVMVGNEEVGSAKCEVRSFKDKKESFTLKKIVEIWDCDWQEKKEEGKAEITLILGEDYWQKLNQK